MYIWQGSVSPGWSLTSTKTPKEGWQTDVLPHCKCGCNLFARRGVPEFAGGASVAVPLHQQVAPVQVSVLKLTSFLGHCQAQRSLQTSHMQ